MKLIENIFEKFLTDSKNNNFFRLFSENKWRRYSSQDKVRILQSLENIVAKEQKREPFNIDLKKSTFFSFGKNQYYEERDKDPIYRKIKEIKVKTDELNKKQGPYDYLYRYFWSLKMYEQEDILATNNEDKLVDDELFNKWNSNNKRSFLNRYLKTRFDAGVKRRLQPLDSSAYKFANETIAGFIKKVAENASLDNYMSHFITNDLSENRLYENVELQDKVYDEILEIEKKIDKDNKLSSTILSQEEFENIPDNDPRLNLILIPEISDKFRTMTIYPRLVARELKKYGINYEHLERTNASNIREFNFLRKKYSPNHLASAPFFMEIVYRVTEELVHKLDEINDKIDPKLKAELELMSTKSNYNLLDKHLEPKNRVLQQVFSELFMELKTSIEKTDNDPFLMNEIVQASKSIFLNYDDVLEKYAGINEEQYYQMLINNFDNNSPVKLTPKEDLNFEVALRSEILPHLENFRGENFHKLVRENKVWDEIRKLDEVVSEYYGTEPSKITILKEIHLLGSYIEEDNVISLDESLLKNSYSLLEIYFHEKRHHLQYEAVAGRLDYKKLGISKQFFEQLIKNSFSNDTYRLHGYVHSHEDSNLYKSQPLEVDAFQWSTDLMFNIIQDVNRIYGENNQTKHFLFEQTHSHVFQMGEEHHKINLKKLEEHWNNNLKIVKEFDLMRENLDFLITITDERLYSYFDQVNWSFLSKHEKYKVASELERRESKKLKRTKITDSQIKDLLSKNYSNESINFVEKYYDVSFKKFIEDVETKPEKYDIKLIEDVINFTNINKKKNINALIKKTDPINILKEQYMDKKLRAIKKEAFRNIHIKYENMEKVPGNVFLLENYWDKKINMYNDEELIKLSKEIQELGKLPIKKRNR